MLVRTLALALAHPELALIAWYELKDARASDAVIGDDHNRHLGVAFADYRPKPALEALGQEKIVAAPPRESAFPVRLAVKLRPMMNAGGRRATPG
jgi:hypothetical protein